MIIIFDMNFCLAHINQGAVPRICDIGLIKPGLNGIFHSSP